MLTPCFEVAQDDAFVIITMRVPFVKASEAEFFIDGCSFKFYCKPYFLRLCLPGELVEDGRERAVHNIEKGTITVYVPKRSTGHHFDNLGMITSLLSKKPAAAKMASKPLIEVLPGGGEVAVSSEMEEEEFDWQVDQQVPLDENEELHLDKYSSFYGFADQHKGVFSKLQHELPALVDCPDPDHMTSHERRVARLAHEEASFSPDHYLADLMESTEMIEYLCQFRPAWCQQLTAWKEMKSQKKELREPNQDIIPFSDAEKMQLKELPNKEFLLDKAAERVLYLGLVDIIFAYAYDYRITEGEHNVESAWTICKISSTLSWLEVFRGSVGEVVYCSVRRSLCYPLYRHWQLVQCVLHDTVQLFQLGRRKLLQCLLAVRGILNSAEPYYIMNNLYISDYCVWIQKASAKQIQNLALELNQVQVEKSSIGWELEELEQAAYLVAAGDTAQQSEEENEHESMTSTSSSDERDTESASHEDNCGHESISDAETSTERSEGHIVDGGNCSATGRDSVSTTALVGESIDTSHAREATKNDNCGEAIADLSDSAKAVQENSEVEREYISTQQPKSGPLSPLSDSGTPTLHPDCICDVGGLTKDLHTLLTLQPQHHPPTTSAQNLIEELN